MSKLGKRMIAAVKEGRAIVRGEAARGSYRVHRSDGMVVRGSGNVFADLGFVDADEHQAKARLVMVLAKLIEKKTLSRARAAEIIGVTQADLSKILCGNFGGVSIEKLRKGIQKPTSKSIK